MTKNNRPSPSMSATLFAVGTVHTGNDGNQWKVILASNNVKRWSKVKSIKRSTTKSAKRSVKRSAKRSHKKSAKRSVKRSAKRSAKKSAKRSHKKSAKRSAKKSAKRSVKRSAKRSVKRSAKRSHKKSAKRSVKRSAKRSVKKSAKRSAKRSHKKSAKRSHKKSAKRSHKKSAKRSHKKSAKRSVKRSAKRSTKRSIKTFSHQQFNKKTFAALLAHKYEGQDPSNYYISEKLDGMRAIYDGKSNSFISRNNNELNAPKFFTEKFPKNLVLDGELFTKRKDFSGTGIFRKKIPVDSEWKKGVYMVFDLPMVRAPFEERYKMMKRLLKGIPYLKVVEQSEVKDFKDMEKIHKKLVSAGAEGTMLREKGSFYEHKRSKTLLKLKDYFDAEVKVIGHELGDGRNEGVLGALHVKWKNSKMGTNEFKVGSGFDDNDRRNYKKLFPIGTILTIKYWEIDKHSKKPRFPVFMHVRHKE
jgi:DNA ligase-1